MKKIFLPLTAFLLLGLSIGAKPLWAQAPGINYCWDGLDYNTTAAGGHEDYAILRSGVSHLCQMAATNNSTATVWAMLFDASALPNNGTIPRMEFPIGIGTTGGEYGYGLKTTKGLVVACSTTEGTLTLTTGGSCNFHATYTAK